MWLGNTLERHTSTELLRKSKSNNMTRWPVLKAGWRAPWRNNNRLSPASYDLCQGFFVKYNFPVCQVFDDLFLDIYLNFLMTCFRDILPNKPWNLFSFFLEKKCRYTVINYMIIQYFTYEMYILHFHFPVRHTEAYRHKKALIFAIPGFKRFFELLPRKVTLGRIANYFRKGKEH